MHRAGKRVKGITMENSFADSRSVGSRVRRALHVLVAWLAGLGLLATVTAGTLAATASVASAATYAPQDCSVNGVTSTITPMKLGVVAVSAGASLNVQCSNLKVPSNAIALVAAEGSPLLMVGQCGGQQCTGTTSPTQVELLENEADVNAATINSCPAFNSCTPTWDFSYTVPKPFKAGGSKSIVTAAGDPNAQCPLSQLQANVGLPGCAFSVADGAGDAWGLVLLKYQGQPTPAAPTLSLGSTTVTAGSSVSLSSTGCTNPSSPTSSTACPYWWGLPEMQVPFAGGTIAAIGGLNIPPAPLVVQLCPTSGGACMTYNNPASNPIVKVAKAVYNCNPASGNGVSCSWTSYPTLSGSIPIPATAAGSYTVHVFEANPFKIYSGNGGSNCPSSVGSSCLEASAPLTVEKNVTPMVSSITPDSSPVTGGGTVTITGINLNGATAVKFGSNASSKVTVVSSTELTATVPPVSSPGTVQVTVTTANGTSVGSGFVYVTPSQPYVPVTPYRIVDTRCSASPPPSFCSSEHLPSANAGLAPPGAGGHITALVAGTGSGSNAVPSGAQAVVLTITAVASASAHSGYLTAYPSGTNPPTASSLNYAPGEAVPNLVTVALGNNSSGSPGYVSILSSSAGVNIIVDVEGYYEPPSTTATNKFTPLPVPIRVLDTRCSASPEPGFCANEPYITANTETAPAATGYIKVKVTGIGSIPSSGVSAVSMVLTAAGPTSGGYLTAWPAGSSTSPPMTSNVNFHAGGASANSVAVEVGSGGEIYIYNSAGTPTNVVVDINGYFSSSGLTMTPSSPVRICDTRAASVLGGIKDVVGGVTGQCANSGTALGPSVGPVKVQVVGIGGVPSSATAVVANVTVVNTTGAGYLTVWAAGSSQPTTSNINWSKGQVVPNMVISKLSSSGQMDVYASSGANVIVDVVGWYS